MKKSLIAVAVAGLFAAPVAMAEVTLSGAINLGIEFVNSSSSGATPSLSRTLLNANYSHVDLESVDDIGGGNKVIFHYQLNATPQNATGINDNNRNSYLGVMGSWGAFKMGTNENVYERMMYTADPLDGAVGPGGNLMILGTPGASAAFQAGQGSCSPTSGCVDFYRRTDQTIWYESPNFGGISFEVDYTLSAFKSATTDPTVLSIGGKWQPEGAPFFIDVAYESHEDMFGANAMGIIGGTGSTDTGMQIGGGFSFGDLSLGLRFELLSYETDGVAAGLANKWERDAGWVSVKYNLPSGYIGAELGIANKGKTNLGDVNDTGAKMFGIGYFHNLSKQSQLQVIYGLTDNESAATYTQAAAPGDGTGTITPGQDSSVIHFGIKHTF